MCEITPIIAIQARQNSRRFPNKWKAEIKGKRVIDRVIDRVSKSSYFSPHSLVFIIPKADEELTAYIKQKNIRIIHDENRDLFTAFTQISPVDEVIIARVTADCPMVSPLQIDMNITKIVSGYEYASNEITLPGFWCEAFKLKALKKYPAQTPEEREHVTLRLRDESTNKWIQRIIVDYPEDIDHIETFLTEFDLETCL